MKKTLYPLVLSGIFVSSLCFANATIKLTINNKTGKTIPILWMTQTDAKLSGVTDNELKKGPQIVYLKSKQLYLTKQIYGAIRNANNIDKSISVGIAGTNKICVGPANPGPYQHVVCTKITHTDQDRSTGSATVEIPKN